MTRPASPTKGISVTADVASSVGSAVSLRVELTEGERSEVQILATKLGAVSPALLDDPGWLDEARRLSCRLPVRQLELLRRLRQDAGPAGAAIIAGLPVDVGALPDTPSVRDSVERVAKLPAVVAMLFGQQLGEVFAFREEKQGALVQNVVPVRALARSQSNAGSVSLELHSENAFHLHRPDFIGLICLRSDHEERAATLVSSIRNALPLLDSADVEILGSPRFVTEAPPSFGCRDVAPPHAVLSGPAYDPGIQVDLNATTALDNAARGALERLGAALAEASSLLMLKSGEMVFIDNRLVVHGRTYFEPRYDGRDRWLHRIYVQLDSRRSLTHRDGPVPVLR